MAKSYGKNKWALFLLILAGLVVGSFVAQLTKKVDFLSWLNYGFDFAIGNPNGNGVVSLNLGALAIHFGLSLRITVGSAIGAVGAIWWFKKI